MFNILINHYISSFKNHECSISYFFKCNNIFLILIPKYKMIINYNNKKITCEDYRF